MSFMCPNPRCPQPTNVRRVVLSGATNTTPGSMGARYKRRPVNRRLMQSRTSYTSWGFAPGVSAVLVMLGAFVAAYSPTGSGLSGGLIGAIVAWVVAVALMVWSVRAHLRSAGTGRRANVPPAKPQVQQPTDLYYCDGCGNVFEPVSGRFVPLDQAANLFD